MSAGPPDFLPYGRHSIEADDIEAVRQTLIGDWLTTGPAVRAFEADLAATVGAPHAVACSSGTAALHLAALALRFERGERAIVPAITFCATANAIRYVDGEVIFADVDPDSGLMEARHLEEAIRRAEAGEAGNGRLRAVFPVHLAGQCAELDKLSQVAREHGLDVVEDASHALGTRYRAGNEEHRVGACEHARMCVFSFHPVKTVTMGEGGAITLRDDGDARALARFRTHGIDRNPEDWSELQQGFAEDRAPNPWYYELQELGFNYRASDVNCALGSSQLAKLDRFVARRQALAARYDELLAPLAPIVRPLARSAGGSTAWHLYVVLIDFAALGLDRAKVMRQLAVEGIGSQVHYIPLQRHPYYRKRYGAPALPGADAYYARALSLPLFPAMRDSDVERVVDALSRLAR